MTHRLRLLFAIAALMAAVTGRCAEEGCVRSAPAPVFRGSQAGLGAHRFKTISSHEAREHVELASGVSVDIHHQGCEYFVTTFRFESADILKNGTSVQAAYQSAAGLLRQLGRLKGEFVFDLQLAAATLDQTSRDSRPLELEQEIPFGGDGSGLLQTQVKIDSAGRNAKSGFVQVTLFLGPL